MIPSSCCRPNTPSLIPGSPQQLHGAPRCYVKGDQAFLHSKLSSFWGRGERGGFVLSTGFLRSSVSKSACKAGDLTLISGPARSPGEGNGNPLQYSCLENLMDREAKQAIVHEVARVGHDLATKPPPQLICDVCWFQEYSKVNQLYIYQLYIHISYTHKINVCACCIRLCNSMDSNPPGSSVYGIFQARILEWVAISFSRRSSRSRDQTRDSCVSCTCDRWILYH